MLLADSHCHLNLIQADAAATVAAAQTHGVRYLLNVSVDLPSLPAVCDTAARFDDVFCSVGVHPNTTPDQPEASVEELVRLARHPKVVAIGETGLDYFRSEGDLEWQHQRFRRHIRAARACGKPLIIHNREAGADTLRILREENAHEVGGVMHCFVEDWDSAQQSMDLGFYISFSGIVSFKSAQQLREVAKKMPADRMLVETDSPYLAPVPHRGKPNQPAYVRHVAECLAELRQEAVEQIAAATTENFLRLFRIAG
jgi:TatD DNase family protein